MFFSLLPPFVRFTSFFLLSPLPLFKLLSPLVRLSLALAVTLLLAPSLQTNPRIDFLSLIQEAILGYAVGFLFALLFEAIALAGQFIGTLLGFSTDALFDPIRGMKSDLTSRLFSLFGAVLFLSLDLHHLLLKTLFESLSFNFTSLMGLGNATSIIFSQMLEFAFLPLSLTLILIALFALGAKLLPHFHLFSFGLPLQLLLGLVILTLTLSPFAPLLEHGFREITSLLEKILFAIR